MYRNLLQTVVALASPLLGGGFDNSEDCPQALLREIIDSLRDYPCQEIVDCVIAMADSSNHLRKNRE